MMEKLFKHGEVKKIFPWVSDRTVMVWAEKGLVSPTTQAGGRGKHRGYSYSNLIEVAFINQLLYMKMPFSEIEMIVRTDEYRQIITNQLWNTVFWQIRQIVSAPVPMDKSFPWVGEYGFADLNDFHAKGGHYILGSGKMADFTTTALIVNFASLKAFVDKQISRSV
jgi:DNA-binding transcriptional MerR regulator